jgi:hypothetical protein
MITAIKCLMPNGKFNTFTAEKRLCLESDLTCLLNHGWHLVARNAGTLYLLAVFKK